MIRINKQRANHLHCLSDKEVPKATHSTNIIPCMIVLSKKKKKTSIYYINRENELNS